MEEPPAQLNSTMSSKEKYHHADDSASTGGASNSKSSTSTSTTAQCSVVSIFRTKILGTHREARVTWSKNLINHSLSVSVDKSTTTMDEFTWKVDLKPWPFWSKKGFKSFEVDGARVDLFWDLRSAKFAGGPEPVSGYYVALVCNEEVILLLGDCNKEAYKRTKSRPSLEEAALVSKRENAFGKKCYSTRANLSGGKKEHEIVVENSVSGPKEPEMWISVDGAVLIHVSNLQWKFRGNETVVVEQLPVQVFWDVHDWLFAGSGHALFVFKPGPPPHVVYDDAGAGDQEQCDQNRATDRESVAVRSDHDHGADSLEFCFILYAWKME